MSISVASTTTSDEHSPVITTIACICGARSQGFIEPGKTHYVQCWRCRRRAYVKATYADVATTQGSAMKGKT